MNVTATTMAAIKMAIEPSSWNRIFGGISFFVASFISVVLNLLLVLVLIKNRSKCLSTPFFVIVWQMIFVDIMQQAFQIIVIVPLTLGYNIYDQNSVSFQAIITFQSLANFGIIYFNFFLSLNRFAIFVFPKFNEYFQNATNHICALIWIVNVVMVVGMKLMGNKKKYSHIEFVLYTEWPKEDPSTISLFMQSIVNYISPVFLTSTVVVYSLTYIFIFIQGKKLTTIPAENRINTRNKSERRFLIQCVIICFAEIIHVFCYRYVLTFSKAYIENVQYIYFINIIINHLVILNHSISPIILFIFHRNIRTYAAQLLGIQNDASQIVRSNISHRGSELSINPRLSNKIRNSATLTMMSKS